MKQEEELAKILNEIEERRAELIAEKVVRKLTRLKTFGGA